MKFFYDYEQEYLIVINSPSDAENQNQLKRQSDESLRNAKKLNSTSIEESTLCMFVIPDFWNKNQSIGRI